MVDVVEKATGELSFGIGYSTGDGVIGDVRLSERNFLGRGQYVKVAVGGGEDKRTVDISFTEPYFLGQRISAGFDGYRRVVGNNDTYSYDSDTIGGGIRTVEDMRGILRAGADKISVNSAAVRNPDIISQGAEAFGSQAVVVAIDARKVSNQYSVIGNQSSVVSEQLASSQFTTHNSQLNIPR